MNILSPATADLLGRLSRYRDRLIAGGRTSSAAVVDAEIAAVRAEALSAAGRAGEGLAANS